MAANRRAFLLGLGATLAAPAIVRAESIMRVASLRRSVDPGRLYRMHGMAIGYVLTTDAIITHHDGETLSTYGPLDPFHWAPRLAAARVSG